MRHSPIIAALAIAVAIMSTSSVLTIQATTVTPSPSRTATLTSTPKTCAINFTPPAPKSTQDQTQTSTPTSIVCYTSTPNLTATQKLINATFTKEAQNLTATQRNLDATSTRDTINATSTSRADDYLATKTAIASTAQFFKEYKTIDYRELVGYAEDHIGDKVVVRGRVFNILRDGFQVYFQGTYEAFVVVAGGQELGGKRLYDNDPVTVYGTVDGYFKGTNSYGGSIEQPQISADFVQH